MQQQKLNKPKTGAGVQSIQRASAILRSFTEAEPELGVMELSRRLGLHKSTVSRILSTLQAEGLVGQNPETGQYRLGLGLVSLAGVALGRLDIRGIAQPYLGDLVEESQETVNITVLDGRECVNIEREASPKPIRYVGWIGRRTPLHCTASGKVMLAFMPPSRRADLLPRRLRRYTEHTRISRAALDADLAAICGQGYAIVHEEFELGFSAVAAPVFDHGAQVAGTVAISGPTFRFGPGTIERVVPALLETTQRISRDLGFRA